MMLSNFSLDGLLALFNSWPAQSMVAIELFSCLVFIAILLRYYGASGLYCFVGLGLITANIQVLKGGQFIFPDHPIAMGTLLFGIIALVFDIITEYFGRAAALKGVRLGFLTLFLFTLLMLVTIGVKPLDPHSLSSDDMFLYDNHVHMKALFMPMPGILAASLISYLTSQYSDVWIYWLIKFFMPVKVLWFRAVLSTSLSALLDTCLFSFLAWKLFSPEPVSWHTLLIIYILGTYPLRLICSFCLSPFIYLAKPFLPKNHYEHLSQL